jgi:hypothetical protein
MPVFIENRVGTKQSLLLEDVDYDGYSLSMLQKIAGAFNQKVEIKFSAIAS